MRQRLSTENGGSPTLTTALPSVGSYTATPYGKRITLRVSSYHIELFSEKLMYMRSCPLSFFSCQMFESYASASRRLTSMFCSPLHTIFIYISP